MDRLKAPERVILLMMWEHEGEGMTTSEIYMNCSDFCYGTIQQNVYSLVAKGLLTVTEDTANRYHGRRYRVNVTKEEYLAELVMSYSPDLQKLIKIMEEKK